MDTKPNPTLYLFPVLTTLFWGATFNVAPVAVSYFSAPMAGALRFLIASLTFLPLMIYHRKKVMAVFRDNWLVHLFMAATGVAGYNAMFFLAMKHTTPLNGALIMATNPLVSSFINNLVTKEKILGKQKVGYLTSFVGVVVLLLSGHGKLGHLNQGDVYMAIACVFLALYGVIGKHYQKNCTPLITTATTTMMATVMLCAIAFFADGIPLLHHVPVHVTLTLFYLGAIGTALAYVLWNYSFQHLGVPKTALFFNLVPLFTVLLSLLFGQKVVPMQLAAGAVVIFGVLIATGVVARPSWKKATGV